MLLEINNDNKKENWHYYLGFRLTELHLFTRPPTHEWNTVRKVLRASVYTLQSLGSAPESSQGKSLTTESAASISSPPLDAIETMHLSRRAPGHGGVGGDSSTKK